ncbi:MAG: glycosyltransferase, partial [Candidatus Omnitrophica bacterium]|nr:glycosyltransferase [Candidatus Omnitrophota bacterium]
MKAQEKMLRGHGHRVRSYTRSSVELESMRFGKVRAFFAGLRNPVSAREIHKVLEEFRPDVVHIHNLYPLISPSVLPHIRKRGVPVVMTVHNYRLICPNGLFYNKSGICEACAGGKEWNCIRFNCEESLPKSIGYALRNAWARIGRHYLDNVDAFLCLTAFQKRKLVDNGFKPERCFVLPNFYNGKPHAAEKEATTGSYVAFAGRISREKGIDILYDAARRLPEIRFKIAGKVADQVYYDQKPDNVSLEGLLEGERLQEFYAGATVFLLSSVCYEGFPMVFLEAMSFGLP